MNTHHHVLYMYRYNLIYVHVHMPYTYQIFKPGTRTVHERPLSHPERKITTSFNWLCIKENLFQNIASSMHVYKLLCNANYIPE